MVDIYLNEKMLPHSITPSHHFFTYQPTYIANNGPYNGCNEKYVYPIFVIFLFLVSFLQTILQVSWVRHRDIHLLTVGRYTYTSDQRFRALHHPHSEDWMLQIKYPQHRDSGMFHKHTAYILVIVMLNELNLGIYECQVSTSTPMSHHIHLNVIGES